MENFKHQGKELKFWKATGKVLDSNKHSETHISSSGGGGSVGPYGGRVDPVKIHSSISTEHEFWIKSDDGTERSFQLSGHDIPLRIGQKVTVISGGLKNDTSGWHRHVSLVNHTAKMSYRLTRITLEQPTSSSIVGYLILAFFIYYLTAGGYREIIDIAITTFPIIPDLVSNYFGLTLTHSKDAPPDYSNPSNISIFIAGVFFFSQLFYKLYRMRTYPKKFDRHINNLNQEVFDKGH